VPEVSESGALVQRLISQGLSYEDVGQAVGRNRSLIRQVGLGTKPGNNLREQLATLERRLSGLDAGQRKGAARSAGLAPARRTKAGGAVARTRRKTTVTAGTWSTATAKRSSVRNGARGTAKVIHDAADQSRNLGVTITFGKGVTVTSAYGKRGKAGGAVLDFELGDPDYVAARLENEFAGNVTALVVTMADERGFLVYDPSVDPTTRALELEVRNY
jgi:hypothetical protein